MDIRHAKPQMIKGLIPFSSTVDGQRPNEELTIDICFKLRHPVVYRVIHKYVKHVIKLSDATVE